MCQASEQETDAGEVDEGLGAAGQALVILAESPLTAEPGERPLNNPALGDDPKSWPGAQFLDPTALMRWLLVPVLLADHQAHLMGHKSNSQLIEWIKKHRHKNRKPLAHIYGRTYRSASWRIRDRLTGKDINQLVTAFKAGTAKHVLADH